MSASAGGRPPMPLVRHVSRFCRALRGAGLLMQPTSAADALQGLAAVDMTDRREVFLSLRLLLCHSPHHRTRFEALFDAYFGEGGDVRKLPAQPFMKAEPLRPHSGQARLLDWFPPARSEAQAEQLVPGVGLQEALADRDVATLPPDSEAEVAQAIRRLARKLSSRLSRRWRVSRRPGTLPALRSSLRRSLSTGGEIVELRWLRRRVRRTRLIVVCDVSGSMELYSRFLLQVVYALQRYLNGVESFAFSTRLHRITGALRRGRFTDAIARAATGARWGGGTKIGHSLAALTEEYGALLSRRPTVIILSDGWDAGEPAELQRAMRRLKGRAGRLIWLNPLLGAPDYQPVTRGMSAALPYLDLFAPCHNIRSLEQLSRHLKG